MQISSWGLTGNAMILFKGFHLKTESDTKLFAEIKRVKSLYRIRLFDLEEAPISGIQICVGGKGNACRGVSGYPLVAIDTSNPKKINIIV